MFVLRTFVVLVIATMFVSCAEAQLFRFRANRNYNARAYAAQQRGYQSAYDSNAYQYTQVQPQTNYIPSQPESGKQQKDANAATQLELVSVTYRDPYTGRLVQRQYYVQRAAPQADANKKTSVAKGASKQSVDKLSQEALPELKDQSLSQASSIGVTSPKMNSLLNSGVQATSFNSPTVVKATVDSSGTMTDFSQQFSILTNGIGGASVANPIIESPLPVLEVQGRSVETQGSTLKSSDELNVDLPPLELEDSK